MQRYLALVLVITSCGGAAVFGQNVSRLYPREKLETDAKRWGGQIRAEYHDTVLPQLNDQERSALSTIKIEVPISGPKGDPFEFYTDGSTIYLPALSLRFYSDLCVANAWLNAHGFDGTTVRDYVGWLFRQAAASSKAPLPPFFVRSAFLTMRVRKLLSRTAQTGILETRSSFCLLTNLDTC